ncbi:flagellar biosynthetic protein FliR [Gemmatimonas aurantiaca]|nr:flagellar biosynthetic protein FliR [Gemmatimonas aurantiaca]
MGWTVFEFMGYGADRLQAFLLVNFRLGGMLLAAPIFSRTSIPPLIKTGFAITMAILLMPSIINAGIPVVPSLFDLTALGMKELLVGVLIGLMMKLLFYAAETAGSFVGFQSGLAIANIVDPSTQTQTNIIGQFWLLVASMIFLAINGHHLVITSLSDSFQVIPLGGAIFGADALDLLLRLSGVMFVLALKMAAPILLTVFLIDVSLGVLARTIPQMNIFIIGIPVKIAAALLLIGTSLPLFSWALQSMTEFLDVHMHEMIAALASGA